MANYSFQAVGPIFIITGAITYNIPNVGYTIIDMDVLTNDQLLLIKKGLEYNYLTSTDEVDVLAYVSTNATEPGSISPEQVQDIVGSMITGQNGADVTYDDEANTILVGGSGGSGGNGGFSFGGDWDATPIAAGEIASFDVLYNATISGNVLTRILPGEVFGAIATNLSHAANTGTLHEFRVTVPNILSGGAFFVGIHNSKLEENVYSALNDTTATMRGVKVQATMTHSVISNVGYPTYSVLPHSVEAGDILKVCYRSDTSAVYIYNETQGNVQLIGESAISGFSDGLENLTVYSSVAGTSPLSFDFADDYPIYQTIFNLDYPEDLTKTYRVSAANANSAINSKLLKAADFVDFITNEDDEVVDVVVSRLVSDSNIRDTISTALNEPTSSVYTQTQSLGGTAGLDAVVSALNEAMNYNPSDLTTSLDNFLTHLLVDNASVFYEALRTQVQDAVQGYIEDDVQNSGVIYNAIAQYVEDSTTGFAGHAIIQTAIEGYIENYANVIGVGPSGQIHGTVQEAAQFVISNEIQSGGIIDTAIQAAINP